MPNKVKLTLVGLDGNAFSLMGAFQQAARKQGWSKAEIDAVIEAGKPAHYAHRVSKGPDHIGNHGLSVKKTSHRASPAKYSPGAKAL